MTAIVYEHYDYDLYNAMATAFIECKGCSVAWGWGHDRKTLEQWAREHNELRHSAKTTG